MASFPIGGRDPGAVVAFRAARRSYVRTAPAAIFLCLRSVVAGQNSVARGALVCTARWKRGIIRHCMKDPQLEVRMAGCAPPVRKTCARPPRRRSSRPRSQAPGGILVCSHQLDASRSSPPNGHPPRYSWGCWIVAGRAARSSSDNLIISTTEQHVALPD